MKNTFLQQHWRFFGSYLAFLAAGGVLQALYSQTDLFLFFNGHYQPLADVFFSFWTFVGDGWFSVIVAIGFLLFLSYKSGLQVGLAYAVSSLLAQWLKKSFFPDSLRPKAFFAGKSVVLHFTDGVEVFSYNSFPSGHAASAFALAGVLCFIFRNRHLQWLWLGGALLVAYSRMYLAEHFFEDVYAGSVLGVLTSLAVQHFFSRLPEKNWYHHAVFGGKKNNSAE